MGKENSMVQRVYEAKGDSLAADALIYDYIPFIKSEASKAVGRIVNEGSDELSIAMIGFHEAVETYSKLKGSFLSYAAVVMHRKLIDYYRKEKRHAGLTSLDAPISEDNAPLVDTLADGSDAYEQMNFREATKQEIAELIQQLAGFDLTLTDIADNCPKQERTLTACSAALNYARGHVELIEELKRTKRLPIAKLCEGTKVERKTFERHRKYIMALMIIHSNGYEIIRGHLKQVLYLEEGGRI